MTEDEYINATALGTITSAMNTLRDLMPEIMPEIIKDGEYKKVIVTLRDWRNRLNNHINTDD